MRREYTRYKCTVCGFETERSYYASDSYGNFHDNIDFLGRNAEREANILKNSCPVLGCRKGQMERKNWLEEQDPKIEKMCRDDYLSLLKQGAPAWNGWRSRHPAANPNLAGFDLRWCGYLNECNFSYTCFYKSNFRGCDLIKCFNFSHLQGVDTVSVINLEEADLRDTNLAGVSMVEPIVKGCDFSCANLHNSVFKRVNLNGVDLRGADLCHVKWNVTVCRGANFTGCNVHGAEIRSFGRASEHDRTISCLEESKGKYVYQGEDGDERIPETGQFSPVEFGMYMDPPEYRENCGWDNDE